MSPVSRLLSSTEDQHKHGREKRRGNNTAPEGGRKGRKNEEVMNTRRKEMKEGEKRMGRVEHKGGT